MRFAKRYLWKLDDLEAEIDRKISEGYSSYYEESEVLKKHLKEECRYAPKELELTGDTESDICLIIEHNLKKVKNGYSAELEPATFYAELLSLLARMRTLTYEGLLPNAVRHKYDWIAAAPKVSGASGRNKDAYLNAEYGNMMTAVLREAMRIPELVKDTYLTVNTACYTAVADIDVVSVDDISNITGYVVKQPRGSKYKLYKTSDMAKPKLYDEVIKRVAIRALYALNSADTAEIIDNFVVNIYSDAPIPATGKTTRRVILSVKASKDEINDLVIDSVSAAECVSYLNGRYNGSLSAARGVKPILLDAFDDTAETAPVKKKSPSADTEKAPEVEADDAEAPHIPQFVEDADEPGQLFDWGEEPEDFNGIDAEKLKQFLTPAPDILNPDNFNSLVSELIEVYFNKRMGLSVSCVEDKELLKFWYGRDNGNQIVIVKNTDIFAAGSFVIAGKFRCNCSLSEVVRLYELLRYKGYMKLVLCSETEFDNDVWDYVCDKAVTLLEMGKLNRLIKEYDLA